MTGTAIGSYAPDFELPGVDGEVHHLARYLESHRAVCVVFMCNHCPYVRLYIDRLKQIQDDFQGQGVTLIGINPNDDTRYPDDSFDKMKSFAIEQAINFPYLRDVTQEVAEAFGAERTPEIYLLDSEGILRYNGAIDDNPQNPDGVQKAYLREAIASILSGTAIADTHTHTIGCSVKWRQPTEG
ncbi:thioredoxin family protein [Thermoleptolyngbya sichuanensis XZ-Cy5]|uniref:thioredoxin family protein n=1 Tax=Thermoleptolyngbya sichuanensis TaxID=2885951 RepID=UPI00240D4D58|nr:thioredoxin family protein [Thermoleptolyngbya sichuanensis]MDG2615858.1 thioredoxin family protein [Thermoleptolyngbya sichuanensis XZ-Cy5]